MKKYALLAFLLLITCKVKATTEELTYLGQAYSKTVVCMVNAGKYEKWDQAAAFDKVFENMCVRVDDLSESEAKFFDKVYKGEISEIEEHSYDEQSEMCDDISEFMMSNDKAIVEWVFCFFEAIDNCTYFPILTVVWLLFSMTLLKQRLCWKIDDTKFGVLYVFSLHRLCEKSNFWSVVENTRSKIVILARKVVF
jgi:hypothetical protein